MSCKNIFGITTVLLLTALLTPAASLAATMVGTELLLSIDVSGSVDSNEFNLQREGYALAFESTDVIQAIENSANGVAVALSYWSTSDNALEIDWSLLTDETESKAFAQTIRNTARNSFGGTGIGNAINFGVDSILNNNFDGQRLVVDVSGDGVNNTGASVTTARDNAVANGITINGLAIGDQFITDFYQNNVIGGSGAFVSPVANFSDVAFAATNKIKTEISNPNPKTTPEPASILGLLTLGGLGFLSQKKQLV